MPFEFVDNNAAIDRAARKRIRSHVAMGRNAGKKLVRPSRKAAFELRVATATASICIPRLVAEAKDLESSNDVVPTIERQIGDGLSVPSFPGQTLSSRRIAQRAFSFMSAPRHIPELSNAIDATGSPASIWVQFMFLDEAYFHCSIAVAITVLNNLVIEQEDPKEAMRHIAYTLRLVNAKLSGTDAVADPTIAVVVIMEKYERLLGRHRQSLVHFKGLQRMVELRGGISHLTSHRPGLAQKIMRTDLEHALSVGSSTRFSVEDILPGSTAIVGLPNSNGRKRGRTFAEFPDSCLHRQFSAELQNLLIDTTHLAWLLNDADTGCQPRLNAYEFHDTILLLGYRLLDIHPLNGPRPTRPLENAVHLGLMAFVMTFFRNLDGKIADVALLSELARSAVQENFDLGRESQEILLWILFIAGASIYRRPEDAWLIHLTLRTMLFLGLQTWEDVRRSLAKFPWVDVVHNEAVQWLIVPAEATLK